MAGRLGAARGRQHRRGGRRRRSTAVHTPGHAPDHLCFWHPESRTLFCGDLAQKGTTIYIPPNLQGDLVAYLASLERVLALAAGASPARARPGDRRPGIGASRRTSSIVASGSSRSSTLLREGAIAPDAIVARLYRGLKDTLVPMARESVLAHLLKLEREGRAGRAPTTRGISLTHESGRRFHQRQPRPVRRRAEAVPRDPEHQRAAAARCGRATGRRVDGRVA